MFMNTPELLTVGQRVIDKCITDMQSNGQEIPHSDAQLVKMLEEYLSGVKDNYKCLGIECILIPLVDYIEEEEVDMNTEDVGEEEVDNTLKSNFVYS